MSINLSLYDVFANTIPGILILYTLNESLQLFSKNNIEFTKLNGTELILLTVLSFVLGHLINLFTYNKWYRLFFRKYDDRKALEKLNSKYPDLKLKFKPTDSELLFTILQSTNKALADKFETNRVNAIMMRNMSFGLFLLSIIEFTKFFIYHYQTTNLLLAIASLMFSFLALRQTTRYYQWFYDDVFKASLIYGSTLNAVIKNIHDNKL